MYRGTTYSKPGYSPKKPEKHGNRLQISLSHLFKLAPVIIGG